jgi:2-keto-4-pentenoate hydratase/2-oxohepta-3-ene-1,7-dioic acid hydratase in catechol pathway
MRGAAYRVGAVEFLPAVTPSKILCVGRNYYEHAKEGGDEPPPMPLLFNKLPTTLNAHDGAGNAPFDQRADRLSRPNWR